MTQKYSLSITTLRAAYLSSELSPFSLLPEQLQTARKNNAVDNVWVQLISDEQLTAYLEELKNKDPEQHPLWGIPFAIKDNIDLIGVPTTAGCPEYAYTPKHSATVVKLLMDAGAIPLGKTNLDQFATGLVGTRSPYGIPSCSLDSQYISGGSSSGSAVAVAKSYVSFSLGTDTAGSGRIPAAFNNLIGVKPSCGLLSNYGVVPACKSLDCVSIFALTAIDANKVFDVAAQNDEHDSYSKTRADINQGWPGFPKQFSVGVPLDEQLEFFGDTDYKEAFNKSIKSIQAIGGRIERVDCSPLLNAAKLLYQGPWVSERYIATTPLIEETPDALLDVTYKIISQGKELSASDAFKGFYNLQRYATQAAEIIAKFDVMLTPTAPSQFTLAELEEHPIEHNSQLGYYTNFMNLLDLAAIAVPSTLLDSGRAFGVTLFSERDTDKKLLALADRLGKHLTLPMGASSYTTPKTNSFDSIDLDSSPGWIDIAVCGAHLSDLALNHQLLERKGFLVESTMSAPYYRMFSVPGKVERPALVLDKRDTEAASLPLEIWRLPISAFGSFIQGIAPPLGIGTVELHDGRTVKGFIAEGYASSLGTDITRFKGWRNYLVSKGDIKEAKS